MRAGVPLTRDLVLIGGGHTHALVLRMWAMRPLPGARLTVINPGPAAPYTGMLPGLVAGHYRQDELEIDLVRLCRAAGARLVLGRAVALDASRRVVTVEGDGRRELPYDVASLDIGITSDLPVEGFAAHGVPAKPLEDFARRWEAFVAGQQGRVPVAVIGAGIGGVELALAMRHRLARQGAAPEVVLIDRAEGIPGVSDATRRRLEEALDAAGIARRFGVAVRRVTAEGVELDGGETLSAAFVVGAAGAVPQGWLAKTGLPLQDGFVTVDAHLRVIGDEALFAAGDCAHLSASPRPKAGVFAVRAATVLLANLRAALGDGRMRAFRPQRQYLKLISLGDRAAVADRGGRSAGGRLAPLLWRWKDRIDRRFMERFLDLPSMPDEPPPRHAADGVREALGERPLCGGCGAKVGAMVLRESLRALPGRADVLTGAGDDAAVLAVGGARQVLTTDHLRSFTEDPAVMTRISALHALGDVWAMGAAPQAALVSVTLPRLSPRLQARWMAEIMGAAGEVMRAAGAAIVGGHSTQGSELTLGFTVTGLLERDAITQAGAHVGDVLLLTRPIGAGVLLAAEMAGRARGRDVAAALAEMQRPQAHAATILRGAHAMTDVTGFGLAGHLAAICRASGTGAELTLAAVPVYAGAEALAAAGVRSSLYEANWSDAMVPGAEGPRGELLYDPQTAGGMLAAVAPEDADAALSALAEAGYTAARIGRITPAAEGFAPSDAPRRTAQPDEGRATAPAAPEAGPTLQP